MRNELHNHIFSANVKRHRLLRGLTQVQLSEKTNIDYKYIQRIEGKRTPNVTLKTIEIIAKQLRIEPAKLLTK